jgi:hypothetical protein
VGGPRRRAELDAAWRAPAGLLAYWERYPPDIIVLQQVVGQFVVTALLARGWSLVHIDDRSVVSVPQPPHTATLIEQERYQYLTSWEPVTVTPDNAAQVLAEAERSIRHCPQFSAAAWAHKVNALQALGRQAEWREAYRQLQAASLASRGHN